MFTGYKTNARVTGYVLNALNFKLDISEFNVNVMTGNNEVHQRDTKMIFLIGKPYQELQIRVGQKRSFLNPLVCSVVSSHDINMKF